MWSGQLADRERLPRDATRELALRSAAVITPNMTTRGKRLAALFGVLIAFALPKRVECGYPGGECSHATTFYKNCTSYEVEPFGFFLIEKLVKSDVGFAYSSGEECR